MGNVNLLSGGGLGQKNDFGDCMIEGIQFHNHIKTQYPSRNKQQGGLGRQNTV